jgi:predicted negative regulator of RcsB-dependent stress response
VAKKTTETETSETEGSDKPAGGKKGYQEPVPVHIGGESLVDRLVPHIKKIAIMVGVVAVVLLAVFGYRWWRDRGRAKSTTELAAALDVARREVVPPEPTPEPDPTNPNPMPVPEPTPDPNTFPSQKARAEAILAQLAKGGAGTVGAVYRGSLLLDAGRLDEAEAAYQSASGAGGLDGVLAREGLGFVHEARGLAATDAAAKQRHFEAALAAFRAAQPADTGPRRDHALYHEARMLALLEKKPEAVAALEKALEIAPDSELQSVIGDRLAQLEAP